MKTIFITMSRGSLIRNFFHTGVISRLLEAGLRVVVLTPQWNEPELFKEYKHKDLYLEPLYMFSRARFRRFFIELYKGAVFNETVRIRYLYRVGGAKPSKLLYIPRMIFFAPLRFIPGSKWLIRFFDRVINPQRAHDYLFEKYKPDLVFNTASGGDGGVLKSAQRFGVRTVDMPKSCDNLSKVLFNTKADYLVVWGDFMKQQAVKFQGYKPEEVVVTGIPQFDFYSPRKASNLLLSREEFCKKFNFDPKKKIILYGSAGANLTDEPGYVELISEFVKEKKLGEVNILVRPHLGYKDDIKRFIKLEHLPNVAVDATDKQGDRFKDKWDTSWDHVINLFNSLRHADVCVNVASTLILDATACGTPVINPNFDIDENADPYTWSVRRLYKDDYIKAVLGTGAVCFPGSKEEFLETLKAILENGERNKENEAKLIRAFLYRNDGKSASRIVEFLVSALAH